MNPRVGWYPDPSGQRRYRYWDGTQWTGSVTKEQPKDIALTAHAEQQDRWLAAGDSRGIYGELGAEMMESLAFERDPLGSDAVVAKIAYSEADRESLIKNKPPAWPHALFGSIMVQRRDALDDRMVEVRLGSAHPDSLKWHDHSVAAGMLAVVIDTFVRLAEGLMGFMTPARFELVFDRAAEINDHDSTIRTADLLMDYHRQYLELAEQVRLCSAPPETADIQRYIWGQIVQQLDMFDRLINNWVAMISAAEEALRFSSGRPAFTLKLELAFDKYELDRCRDLILVRQQAQQYYRINQMLGRFRGR